MVLITDRLMYVLQFLIHLRAVMWLSLQLVSAPSERVFSVAGLVLQAKRSSLAPNTVNKHNNVHLVHEMNTL